MGFVFSRIFSGLVGSEQMRIIIIGLDNAGKTTILCKFIKKIKALIQLPFCIDRLHLNDVEPTVPTVGFNVEQVTFNNLKLQVWDLGGQTGLRPYWRCYYADTNAVVYAIDSADKDRLDVARQELELMLQEEELKGAPLLVLANK